MIPDRRGGNHRGFQRVGRPHHNRAPRFPKRIGIGLGDAVKFTGKHYRCHPNYWWAGRLGHSLERSAAATETVRHSRAGERVPKCAMMRVS